MNDDWKLLGELDDPPLGPEFDHQVRARALAALDTAGAPARPRWSAFLESGVAYALAASYALWVVRAVLSVYS